jgi:hypothetical protein
MGIIEIGRCQMAPTNLRFICPDCLSESSHCIQPGLVFGREGQPSSVYETRMIVCDECRMLFEANIHPTGVVEFHRAAMLLSMKPFKTLELGCMLDSQEFLVNLRDAFSGQWRVQEQGGEID